MIYACSLVGVYHNKLKEQRNFDSIVPRDLSQSLTKEEAGLNFA